MNKELETILKEWYDLFNMYGMKTDTQCKWARSHFIYVCPYEQDLYGWCHKRFGYVDADGVKRPVEMRSTEG